MSNDKYIFESFLAAYDQLRKKDSYLLINRVWEGTVAHRLAVYLEPFFPEYSVDCEYNKSGENRKKLLNLNKNELPTEWTKEQHKYVLKRWARHVRGNRSIRPDIIVHLRGHSDIKQNILAIECKHSGYCANEFAWDWCKLREFTSGHQTFQYQMGILAVFDGINIPAQAWVFQANYKPIHFIFE